MADLVGQRLGPFEVRELIGVGGFATVYRGFDPRFDADVAIKVLADNHALNLDVRGRFLSEGLALRRVDSPAVINVHDVRETPDGRPFLVLDFADRGDLLQRRRQLANGSWRPGPGDVRRLVATLTEALEAVHAEELVHRDVTPSNLLIRSTKRSVEEEGLTIVQADERMLLSDMGLAKDLAQGSGFTAAGGTAGFAAPEQIEPLARVDHRADVYAASAVVLWFITGDVAAARPDWPGELRRDGWPSALIDALRRGLATDPDQRPDSMLDWRQTLLDALSGPLSRPRPATSADPGVLGTPPASRGRLLKAGLAAVSLAGLVVAALAVFPLGDEASEGSEASERDEPASVSTPAPEPESALDDEAEPDGGAEPDGAASLVDLVVGYDETQPSPDRVRPELFQPVIDPAYGTRVTRITDADPVMETPSTSSRWQVENADGTMLLTFHGRDAGYHVTDRSDGSVLRRLDLAPGALPHWHPTDPDRIRHLVVGDLTLAEVDVGDDTTTELVDLTDRLRAIFPDANSMSPWRGGSPSGDGSRYAWLVFDESENRVGAVTYDLTNDRILGDLSAADFPAGGGDESISMSVSGDYVVLAQLQATHVLNVDLTNPRLIYPGLTVADMALNPDGDDSFVFVNVGGDDGAGWLISVDLDDLERTLIFDLYDGANTGMDLSGRGFDRPGWIVASTHGCWAESAWTCDKVMAIELQPGGRVLNLAHTYSCTDESWFNPEAVVSRDFRRVYFNSDNGDCGAGADLMMIDVPDFR